MREESCKITMVASTRISAIQDRKTRDIPEKNRMIPVYRGCHEGMEQEQSFGQKI